MIVALQTFILLAQNWLYVSQVQYNNNNNNNNNNNSNNNNNNINNKNNNNRNRNGNVVVTLLSKIIHIKFLMNNC